MANNTNTQAQELPTRLTRCGITLDVERQRLTREEWVDWLLPNAEEKKLLDGHRAMMRGDAINTSENRAALHTLLRASKSTHPAFPEVSAERERMLSFAEGIRSGNRRGCRNHRIKNLNFPPI